MNNPLEKSAHLEIYYEKNPSYKSFFIDGLIGGKTPTGSINLNFYATRNIIPKSVKHEVENGLLSQTGVNSDDSKVGIIREIEAGVYMDETTANDIYEFLKVILNK